MVLKRSSGHKQYHPQAQHPLWITSYTSSGGQPSLREHSLRKQGYVRARRCKLLSNITRFVFKQFSSTSPLYVRKNRLQRNISMYVSYSCNSGTSVQWINQTPPLKNQHKPTILGDERRVYRVGDVQETADLLGSRSQSPLSRIVEFHAMELPAFMVFPDIRSSSQLT